MNLNREAKLESALRLLLDVTLHEVSCFEQSETFRICEEALAIKRQTDASYQGRLSDLRAEIISTLCSISEHPKDWLPHTVFVEDEEIDNRGVDSPAYIKYKLVSFNADGECQLLNVITNEQEERHLSEIEINWLVTVLNRYSELGGELIETPDKELYVFTYRAGHTDEDIIKNWESGDSYSSTKRYTLNEFADLLNEEKYPCSQYYMRFIKM